MSRFSTEFRANAGSADVIRTGQSILEEMGLIFFDRDGRSLKFREKQRFDPFNPATVELKVIEGEREVRVQLESENLGEGPYQETHLKRILFEIMDRMEMNLKETTSGPGCMDSGIAHELEVLSNLHSKGVLTDMEFERAKKQILS